MKNHIKSIYPTGEISAPYSPRRQPTVGTVIHATLRTQDLLPTLLHELLYVDGIAHAKMQAKWAEVTSKPQWPNDESWGWWDSEDASYMLEDLIDALDQVASAYNLRFGTTEGDTSDFGYWPIENNESE